MTRISNNSSFKGGLNQSKNFRQLSLDEASELLNVEFTADGSITKCKGFINQNTVALGDGEKITGIYEFILSTGASYLIVCAGDKIYVSQDAKNFTVSYTGITPGKYFQFITFFDYAIMVNGADKPLIFDGVETKVAPWWSYTHSPSIVTVWKNRIWMSGAPTAPYFVWYSSAGTTAGISFDTAPDDSSPFASNPGGQIAIDINDGDTITALSTFYNNLIVYKQRSIHQITGDSPSNFTITTLLKGKGCKAPRSVVNIYNEQYFIDETGVNMLSQAYNSNDSGNAITVSISNKVTKEVASFNRNSLSDAYTIHYENRKQVWFIFPEGSSLKNNRVLVLDYSESIMDSGGKMPPRPWTIRSGFTTSCGTYYQGKPLLGSYNGFIQKHDETDSYNGDPIIAYWSSSWFDFGNPSVEKHLIDLDVTLELVGNFDLSYEISIDYQDPIITDAISQKPEGFALWGEAIWGTDEWTTPKTVVKRISLEYCWGKVFRIKISNSFADQPFRVMAFDFQLDPGDWQPAASEK